MSRKSAIMLLLLIVSPVALYLLWPSDEARIRKIVKRTAEAVEREDLDTVMSAVHFGYSDGYGMSYLYLKQTLRREFNVLADMEVEYEGLSIEVKDSRATAEMAVRVIATMGEMRGYYMGDLDNPLMLRIALEKDAIGKWLVLKAEYRIPKVRF